MTENFRLLILKRLKERDGKCRIFERIFDAREFFTISFVYFTVENTTLR